MNFYCFLNQNHSKKTTIENQLDEGSAGFKSCGNKILKKINI